MNLQVPILVFRASFARNISDFSCSPTSYDYWHQFTAEADIIDQAGRSERTTKRGGVLRRNPVDRQCYRWNPRKDYNQGFFFFLNPQSQTCAFLPVLLEGLFKTCNFAMKSVSFWLLTWYCASQTANMSNSPIWGQEFKVNFQNFILYCLRSNSLCFIFIGFQQVCTGEIHRDQGSSYDTQASKYVCKYLMALVVTHPSNCVFFNIDQDLGI